jgi:ABC-2 type transport system permease protein
VSTWRQAHADRSDAARRDREVTRPIIDTIRSLLAGGGVEHGTAVIALVWCAGILALSYAAAAALFRRRTVR